MKDRNIKIRFPNGEIFYISGIVIAESRANYYSDIDDYEIGSSEWDAEVQFALNSEFELEDWMRNNMNWSDIEPHARKEEAEEEIDYDSLYFDADIEIS
jgi:hypothetical protein